MKIELLMLWVFFHSSIITAQETGGELSSRFELLAERMEENPDNDQIIQDVLYASSQPIPINLLDEQMLADIFQLSPLQIRSFILYRKKFGNIRNRYELQAIPFWNHDLIRRLLPYLIFTEPKLPDSSLRQAIIKGRHLLLIRTGSVIEKIKGQVEDSAGVRKYAGDPMRVFFRYTYQYKQNLWWGVTGEKDSGERFMGPGWRPTDFSSFHLFLRRKSVLKTIALGDFTLNIGHGLIQWQGLAFGKTGESISVFRQGELLKPYRSGGEFNFHRGLALQLQHKKIEMTIFASRKKISANLMRDEEAVMGFKSLMMSGYHRTKTELDNRNNLSQVAYGGVGQYIMTRFRAGISHIRYQFSYPMLSSEEPYNRFLPVGRNWWNTSIHYNYSTGNLFMFGELANCKTGISIMQGAAISLHPQADISVVYRNFQPGYKSFYSSAFAEGSNVSNEKGIYFGLRYQPHPSWSLFTYIDFFSFPWLRYRVDAPGNGLEYLAMIKWLKRKQWDTYFRFRFSVKPQNAEGLVLSQIQPVRNTNIRLHAERIWNRQWVTMIRTDHVFLKKGDGEEQGHSLYLDNRYQFRKHAFTISSRIQYFNTTSYDSRIYAYERDVLYSFSIPSFFGNGFRYYTQIQGKLPKSIMPGLEIQWWFRWAQSYYFNKTAVGSGWEEINGRRKSEWKIQIIVSK